MIIEHLIADTFGSHIRKYSKRLKITQGKETLAEAPLMHLRSVHVTGRGISISADALETCCELGIPIFFLDNLGHNYATIYSSALSATVLTRREQLLAYYDSRALHIVREIATSKIHNQSVMLKYLAKNRQKSAPELYEELRHCSTEVAECDRALNDIGEGFIDDFRAFIMGVEGNAARIYWQAAGLLIPVTYEWQGRRGRGATDPVNSLLNYGYGILYGQIEQTLTLAGLDPYGGYLHADRPGKPSLVLDMIEEFRQIAVDKVVWGLVNRGFKVKQSSSGLLEDDTKRQFAEHILNNFESHVRYDGKKFPLRIVMQSQARRLASYLRGERASYIGFQGQW